MPLGVSGGTLEHHGDPIWHHGVARSLNFQVFVSTSVQNLIFPHFWVPKKKEKLGISREAYVLET